MGRTRTLAELETAIRWQADMLRANLRHTPEALRFEINQSIQDYREMLSDAGQHHFLSSFSGRLTPGAAVDPSDGRTPFAWGLLSLELVDPPFIRIYGLDVNTGEGKRKELDQVEWKQRNYLDCHSPLGHPVAFFIYDGDQLGIIPPPAGNYSYTLWYLAEASPLVDAADVFDPALPGGDKWVVWDVCEKIASRDNFPSMLIAAQNGKASAKEKLAKKSGRIGMVGPMKRIDTRGRSMRK